jgi:hypothetical protein
LGLKLGKLLKCNLFKLGTAFGATGVDFGPILDAFSMKVMLTSRVYRMASFFIFHQANGAYHFPLYILDNILKLIIFVWWNAIIYHRIVIVIRLK